MIFIGMAQNRDVSRSIASGHCNPFEIASDVLNTGGNLVNWEAIGAIGDFVSGVGVILTLGYLAVQVRSSTKALRGQAQREIGRNITAFVSREVLEAAVKVKERDGYDEISQALMNEYGLTPEQAEAYWRYLIQMWFGFQADFKTGVLDEQLLSVSLTRNDQRLFWEKMRFAFDPAFVERVRRIDARRA